MNQRSCRVCILGGGPAALMAEAMLRKKGVETCIVAESILGNLMPIHIGGVRVAPIPIFVSQGTYLFRQMARNPLADSDFVTTNFSPLSNCDETDEIMSGSYAEFMMQKYPDAGRRLTITKKHVGPIAFQQDLPELRRKVQAHYPPGHTPTRREGFSDGVSPYLRYLECMPSTVTIREKVLAVDIEKRCVNTNSHRVKCDRIISTLPLLDFLALANIKTSLTIVGGGAQILVASTSNWSGRNQLIYDCDGRSPVHRVFTPREGFVIAQIARAHWGIDDLAVTTRMQSLCDFADRPTVVGRITAQNVYPLASSNFELKNEIIRDMEHAGVTIFGRLAQWEYLDLEDLNWERIECLS